MSLGISHHRALCRKMRGRNDEAQTPPRVVCMYMIVSVRVLLFLCKHTHTITMTALEKRNLTSFALRVGESAWSAWTRLRLRPRFVGR